MTGSLLIEQHGVWVPCRHAPARAPAPAPVQLSAVQALGSTPFVTSVVLGWTAPATGEVTGYRVYQGATLVTTSASTTAVVTGLPAGSAVSGTIRPYGPTGEGPAASWSTTTLTTAPRPTPSNTGPAVGSVTTTHAGTYTLLADGVTVTGLHITGDLIFRGSDSEVADCLVDGTVYLSSGSRQTLRRVKAAGLSNPGGFETVTLDGCFFGGDGINDTISQLVDSPSRPAHGLTVRNCYFHGRPTYSSGDPHWECVHWVGITAMDITNNVFDYKPATGSPSATADHITAVVTFERSWTGTDRVPSGIFSGNWIIGGGRYYQSYLNLNAGSVIDDNDFSDYGPAGAYTIAIPNPDFTASGNTRTSSTGAVSPLAITY